MRGFGYCEYSYQLKGFGLNITAFSYGVIERMFQGIPNGQDPPLLAGDGAEISHGAYHAAGTNWVSYYSDGRTPSFKGTSKGFVVGYKTPDSSFGGYKTKTQLLFPEK